MLEESVLWLLEILWKRVIAIEFPMHRKVAATEIHHDVLACVFPALVLSDSQSGSSLFRVADRHFVHFSCRYYTSFKNHFFTSLWSENLPTWIIFVCLVTSTHAKYQNCLHQNIIQPFRFFFSKLSQLQFHSVNRQKNIRRSCTRRVCTVVQRLSLSPKL